MDRIDKVREILAMRNCRSCWDRGVKDYALELLETFEENYGKNESVTQEKLLNGAQNWHEYSWGGCSLIYDYDIAVRLATPSQLKRTKNGELRPSKDYDWLDWQALALRDAANIIRKIDRILYYEPTKEKKQ